MRYELIIPQEPPNGTVVLDNMLGEWTRNDSELFPGAEDRWVNTHGQTMTWRELVLTFGPLDSNEREIVMGNLNICEAAQGHYKCDRDRNHGQVHYDLASETWWVLSTRRGSAERFAIRLNDTVLPFVGVHVKVGK